MEMAKLAKSLEYQRLESCLNLGLFMDFAHKTLSQPLTSSDSEQSDLEASVSGGKWKNGLKTLRQERRNDKCHVYNFSQVGIDRKWLQDVILSDTDDTDSEIDNEDRHIKSMLRQHVKEKKFRERFHKIPNNCQFAYYGSGLLANEDTYPENSAISGVKRKRKEREKKIKPAKEKLLKKPTKFIAFDPVEPGEIDPNDIDWDDGHNLEIDDDLDLAMSFTGSNRGRKRKSLLPQTPEVMTSRRRKMWQLMAKKEIGKVQRARTNNHKEMLQNAKRMATMCMRVQRQKAIQSQKLMKDSVWRAKRLTREMLGYWKRYDRVEREQRRQMEKEAEEQRKRDVELIEVKRQQRKLNFLITQTELYAHFMSKKLGQGSEEEQLRILTQLDEEVNPRLSAYDDYDADELKEKAQKNAQNAFTTDRGRTQLFNVVGEEVMKMEPMSELQELPQPDIFQGTLKTYQLKGMTWLANLYDQGISGILADEMGLGKTVQSIAFLCHIAERYGVWGPFLIVSPASTLHNWQQEMEKFVPSFNVVPYWGSPNERKILRQFWEQKDLHTKQASFHVVITSYQLIVSDYKYFNRIKWQYMVLDEAQAIKSSSSQRWKLLLGFNCRNRLLLSGTPIQNSMAELWALLHFIMPTLFDSHDEFNEWFSKDIESHAENKTGIDEKQISRLHMILKPFMLRRIKKDVENELSDKIEIMVYCPLTTRQKLLYIALKKKIKVEDLLHLTGGGGVVDKNFTSNLMNLVMQFRKVCNHPELFERRDARSPFAMRECYEYTIPKLIFNDGILSKAIPSKKHLLYNRFSIFKAVNVQNNPCFSFSRFTDLTVQEVEKTTIGGLIEFLKYLISINKFYKLLSYRKQWNWSDKSRFMLLEPTLENPLNKMFLPEESVLRNFLFTSISKSQFYTFGSYETTNIQETIEHRVIRSKVKDNAPVVKIEVDIKEEPDMDLETIVKHSSPMRGRPPKNFDKTQTTVQINLVPEFPHKYRPTMKYTAEPLDMPKFLMDVVPKVQAKTRRLYCESRSAEWDYIRHVSCENDEGKEIVYSSLEECHPESGWSSISIPDKQSLVSDAGKLSVLDSLLTRLKSQGHRVLIYSQMTRMIDLLEEYMWHRKHRYMRLDGSSKISERRDMVADFQNRSDIFVFLLSTRAGGLGINLTAADTVIFYDSDWNPTVDQQAMDRAHRLGQTKQVTVYRLICKGTIEERILQRAREKSEIQRMVISGGNFKPDTLKPKEVVSLLLDDEEIQIKYKQRTHDISSNSSSEKRKLFSNDGSKKMKMDGDDSPDIISTVSSPSQSEKYEPFVPGATAINEDSENDAYVDCDSPMVTIFSQYDIEKPRRRHNPRGTKRGRPRGVRRGGGNGVLGRNDLVGSTPSTSSIGSNSSAAFSGDANSSPGAQPVVVKRGPGRPRLKPGGPANHSIRGTSGLRGITRPRKPMGPLVVPLGQHCSPAATPVNNRSPAMSPAVSPSSSDKHIDITN